MWRLARWTALNDFRASCISDHDRRLQESVKCEALLATPARPPPVAKRTVYEADETFRMTALRWTENIVIFVVTSIVFLVWLKGYTEEKHYVEHSMVKLDVSRIHKLGMGTEQICVIIPAGEPDPAQELEEWDSADDNDYNITQTGAGSGDAASEIDSDDDQTHFPAVKLFEGRNGTDAGSEVDSVILFEEWNGTDAGSEVDSVSTFEVRNGPDAGSEVDSGSLPWWPFGADDADDLPNEQNGTDAASEVNSDKRLTRFPVKSTKERDRTNAAPEVDSVPSHASDQEADKPSTVSTLYDRRANWIQTARVEDEPFEFDGPISALKFSDSIGTRDLRASHKNELDLRAVKIPIQRGVTTLRLMASDMLTITERYARHGVENHVVWESTLNASERLLKRLSLRGRRYIYLILDPQFVKNACPPLPEPEIEFEFPKRKLGLNTIWEGDEEEEKKEDDVN
jgi:hypothetical protein